MLVCDLKAVAEVAHDLFNLFKCHEESFSKWQFLFFSLNWEVQHVAKKKKLQSNQWTRIRRPHSTQCSFKISCYQTSQCFFLGSVISVTVSLCNLPLSAVGDSVCGFCVFRCSLDTQVHRSHSVGVFHHLASAGALPAQTQQEADLLLLAFSCKWCVTALDIVRESEKKVWLPVACSSSCSFLFVLLLQDVLNSVFASVYFITLSLMAMTSYINTGMLIGGVRCI